MALVGACCVVCLVRLLGISDSFGVSLKNVLRIFVRLLVRYHEKFFIFTQLKECLEAARILYAVVHGIIVFDHADLLLFEMSFYVFYFLVYGQIFCPLFFVFIVAVGVVLQGALVRDLWFLLCWPRQS